MILPIILSGGAGSRLWPLSRQEHPKQFIRLSTGQSLIQKAYLRALDAKHVGEIITVTNRDLFFYTKDEYEAIKQPEILNTFILEPFGKNSAAAVALAAKYVETKYGGDVILLVLTADHLIEKQDSFLNSVKEAVDLALQGKLVTFGIKPELPKTGYGYIEADGNSVRRFVEKPTLETAKMYVESGRYFWNSGMFCMKARTVLDEMEEHCPQIVQHVKTALTNSVNSDGLGYSKIEILSQDFESIENISIDYALFEKSSNLAIVPCDIGWSDIGSWVEFGDLKSLDDKGNSCVGDVVLQDVDNCVMHSSEEGRLIAGLGIKDLVVVDTADAVLVASKDHAQDVRKIVDQLKKRGHSSYSNFPTVHRPWGIYTVLQEGVGFKMKRIEVKSGASLSLQSHNHRSEHWIVVSGIAVVTNGDNKFELKAGQSTYIPLGNKHRLENPGTELLVLIEVQCGSYLGEDDIIRYDDKYGRLSQ